MMSELSEIKNEFEVTRNKYREYLPKVDPSLLDDLLRRQMQDGEPAPMYMVEVFLEPGIDSKLIRETVLRETGVVPAIYDHGTHVAAHHRLTLEMLKSISEKEGVIEITGEYEGDSGSWAASHEHRNFEDRQAASARSTSGQRESSRIREQDLQTPRTESKSDYKVAALVAGGIIGAIALVGFILSGGLPPNSNSSSGQFSITGTEPGVLYGYVSGPVGGLPAVGTTIIAVDLATGQTTSAFVSVDGQYLLNLAPFTYRVIVAFPDGTSKEVASELQIERGAAYELDISY